MAAPPAAPPSESTSVLVLGEALVDLFPDGPVVGGAPFNVARNLAALGAAPLMLTRIGRDAIGAQLLAEFERHGLSQAALQHDEALPSGQVRVHPLPGGGHHFEIPAGQAWDALDSSLALAAVQAHPPRLVVFGTLAQRVATAAVAVRAAVRAAAAAGALVALDLNLRDGPDNRMLAEASLPLADLLKVNEHELPQLLHWFVPGWAGKPASSPLPLPDPADPELVAAVRALMSHFRMTRVVLTLGAHGHAVYDQLGGLVARGPAAPVQIRDTVGAGDAFLSVVLLGELHGWSLATSLQRAADFAAAVCGITGAVSPDPAFYARWRAAWGLDACAATPSAASTSMG